MACWWRSRRTAAAGVVRHIGIPAALAVGTQQAGACEIAGAHHDDAATIATRTTRAGAVVQAAGATAAAAAGAFADIGLALERRTGRALGITAAGRDQPGDRTGHAEAASARGDP